MYNFKENKNKNKNKNKKENIKENIKENKLSYKNILEKVSIIQPKYVQKEENIKLITPPKLIYFINKECFDWNDTKDKITYFEDFSYS